jgi:rhomboid protease GluP
MEMLVMPDSKLGIGLLPNHADNAGSVSPADEHESADRLREDSPSPSFRPFVTYCLVFACVLLFASTWVFHLTHRQLSGEAVLLRWGANFGPSTVGGQWWRLLTSVFVHMGLIHLAINMWCLWDLGSFVERVYGRSTYFFIFGLTGITGALVSIAWRPFAVEAGASGTIFGLAGVVMACCLFGDLCFSRKTAGRILLSVAAFAVYSLLAGLWTPGVGNAAHLGGLISGLVVGLLLVRLSRRTVVVLSGVALLASCILVAKAMAFVVPAGEARRALAAGQNQAAIDALNISLQEKPTFADGYLLLGQAYMQQKKFPAAESAFRRAIEIDPHIVGGDYQLGMVLLLQNRANEASDVFNNLARKNPKDAQAQVGLGAAAEATGDYQRAFDAFQRAAKLDPKNPETYANLGLAAMQIQSVDDAIAAFSNSARLQPNNPSAFMNLALAYKLKGMNKEAQEAYRRAAELQRR